MGVVFPGEGCSFRRILQASWSQASSRWGQVGQGGGPPLSPPPGVGTEPFCSLQPLYLLRGAGETAGWWGQNQMYNLSVPSAGDGGPAAPPATPPISSYSLVLRVQLVLGVGGSTGWGTPWEGPQVTGTRVKSPLPASRKTDRASWEATGCARAWEQQGTGLLGTEGCLRGVGIGGDPGTEPQLGRCGAKAKGTGNKCISNIWDQKRRW